MEKCWRGEWDAKNPGEIASLPSPRFSVQRDRYKSPRALSGWKDPALKHRIKIESFPER